MRLMRLVLLSSFGGLVVMIVAARTGATSEIGRVSYDVTTELGMPNLEENLRYTITHEKKCLTQDALRHLFPILSHPALAGCFLGQRSLTDAGVSYPLVCEGKHGTSGSAEWTTNGAASTGTLNIKLGGKNMTLFQRVRAISRGAC